MLKLDRRFPLEQFEASRAIRGCSISVSSALRPLRHVSPGCADGNVYTGGVLLLLLLLLPNNDNKHNTNDIIILLIILIMIIAITNNNNYNTSWRERDGDASEGVRGLVSYAKLLY